MPKSKVRRKDTYRPKAAATNVTKKKRTGSGRWVAPTMITLFLLGLVWIVLFYITASGGHTSPIPLMKQLGNWNILLGFAFIGGGFACATRWR